MRRRALSIVVGLMLMLPASVRGQDPLAAAQKLYLAAQFDEALQALDGLKTAGTLSPDAAFKVEQTRVLCLLALDRRADAERAIEAVLDVDPFYQPGEDEAAPKVRTTFHEVRRRALPEALKRLYGRAKQAYDRKALGEAAADFKRVLTLLEDTDMVLDQSAKFEMRLVAQAFVDLAEAAAVPPPLPASVLAVPATGAPTAPTDGATPGGGALAADTAGRTLPTDGAARTPPADGAARTPQGAPPGPSAVIYDGNTPRIVPPVSVRNAVSIPEVMRPIGAPREAVVEIVVSADGSIESVTMRQPVGTVIDALLLSAVRNWRYRPATRNGVAVRFRMLVKVVVPPRNAGTTF